MHLEMFLLRKKYLRVNDSNFVTKKLSKAIVVRSRLRNHFFKTTNRLNLESNMIN